MSNVRFLPQRYAQAQQVSAADEERMRQRSEAPRPPTKYERDLEALCRDYVKRKEETK